MERGKRMTCIFASEGIMIKKRHGEEGKLCVPIAYSFPRSGNEENGKKVRRQGRCVSI